MNNYTTSCSAWELHIRGPPCGSAYRVSWVLEGGIKMYDPSTALHTIRCVSYKGERVAGQPYGTPPNCQKYHPASLRLSLPPFRW